MQLTFDQIAILILAKESAKQLAAMLQPKGAFRDIEGRNTLRSRTLAMIKALAKLERELKPDNPDLVPDAVTEKCGLTQVDHDKIRERAWRIRHGKPLDDEDD